MSLARYKQKRHFQHTPEPKGGEGSDGRLSFLVQEHAASHLHYDFRLEMKGVLKSWAIPKGPSMNPADKRLAMQVEDHPYDYKDFEGIIPEGNYGAGTVIVWDRGTYEGLDTKASSAQQQRTLLKQLKEGSLKFSLHGEKLKGAFALVRIKGKEENAWLLIKHKDRYATTADVTRKNKSVVSGKTISALAKASRRPAKPAHREKDVDSTTLLAALGAKKRTAFPKNLKPMLATLVDKPFDDPGWVYEVKWDGYRALAYIQDGKVSLRSRNNKDFDKKYYPLHDTLSKAGFHAVLDGEIVVMDERGRSVFNSLQNWRSEADGPLHYYVFDLLWLAGYSLMQVPLTDRKRLLQAILLPSWDNVHFSEAIAAKGTALFRAAEKNGLEGMVAKQAQSTYQPGARSNAWLKIKTVKRQEVVIGGYTLNEGSPKLFSSLLVGVYEGKQLLYAGKIGTGFDQPTQQRLMRQFTPLITRTIPFATKPDVNKPSRFRPDPPKADAVWLKPRLVCEVAFREMTEDGLMRHPSFQGMRDDKPAGKVHLEEAKPSPRHAAVRKTRKTPAMTPRKTLLNPTDDTQTRPVNGHELSFTHLSKVYWPKEGYSKRDMLNYYYKMAPYILPYLVDRPQSLNRHPDGITGKGFYQKDVTGKAPEWATLFPYHTEGESVQRNFLVCTGEDSLLYMAGLGCIEMNPWSSRVDMPDNPDWCVIDLDPSKNNFDQVIETARVTHDILEAIKVPSYCKTTGSTGLHIYIPLGAKYTYEQSKEFARVIVRLVQRQLPRITTIERTVSQRGNKIYLDFLQNRPQATLATAYSLRPKPGATVSMPLDWEEVKKGLAMKDFTLLNAPDRAREMGDLFKPVLGKGIDLGRVIKAIGKTFE